MDRNQAAIADDAFTNSSAVCSVPDAQESTLGVASPFPTRPELLSPAGDWECARAAVENGADAIYFGLNQFNARMRAHNFTSQDLPRLLEYLHLRGVKAFVTFNVLVFPNELAEAEQYLRAIIEAGVDAAIVQDVGICRLIRRISPDFPIHASTQMTISSAAGLAFARALGCSLVALARECSLPEIGKIQAEQNAQLDLEVFVHGALCIAYSGQCLTSESLGGRSANRGVCAQACRLPYELLCDGQTVPLHDKRYLLSPRDLAGLEVLPELMRAGVKVFKIEGRLKTPEYVANITSIYRRAIDQHWAGRSAGLDQKAQHQGTGLAFKGFSGQPTAMEQYQMEMAFSRGLYTGWLKGINNQELVHARFGKKRGVYLGQVARIERSQVALDLQGPLKPGDGIVFDAGHPDQEEEGGRVYGLKKKGVETWLSFGQGDINFSKIHPGDHVWKTSDPALDRSLQQTYSNARPHFLRPVRLGVWGGLGRPLRVSACDDLGNKVQVESSCPLIQAEKHPLTTERLKEQLGRLGGTPFRLAALDNHLSGDVILPISALNDLRRQWVERMEAIRSRGPRWKIDRLQEHQRAGTSLTAINEKTAPAAGGTQYEQLITCPSTPQAHASTLVESHAPELIVLVRNMAQFMAALHGGARTIYCEFEDPKKYREAVQRAGEHISGAARGPSIWVAPPRISKPGEQWLLKQVRASNAAGYLVRNYDHLHYFAGCRCVGDFSLNIANPLSADYFVHHYGLERVTAAYDLNETQLADLLKNAPPAWFEVTIHHHMPMFHMEHCVFCAFLSTGTDYTNCGRPCEKHDVQLRDRVGARHPVKADAGCRNTVFNARAQTGAEAVAKLIGLGLRYFRVEFLNEGPEEMSRTINLYRQLLAGELDGTQLWRQLKLLNHLGITRGPE